jgi:hypothetical protein
MLKSMGSKIRWILIASLGGLLLLTVLTGIAALVVFQRLEAGEAALRSRLVDHSRLLEQIRGGVLLSGTLARDYFMDPAGSDAPALLERLAQSEQDTRQAVTRYGDHDAVQLHGEVVAYWKLLNFMVQVARQRPAPGLDAYFRRQLAERRETMLRIAGDIGGALDREAHRGELELAGL